MRSGPKSRKKASASASLAGLPLTALLSQLFVAFTIEFDNEAERQLPHSTTNHGSTADTSVPRPWLVSMAMWFNCLRFISEDGITIAELYRLARTRTNLRGMRRWGYVTVQTTLPGEVKLPKSQWILRPTRAGRRAQKIWGPLIGGIENRWRERFGAKPIEQLRQSLCALVQQFDFELPDTLPILGYGLACNDVKRTLQSPAVREEDFTDLPLPALLAKVMLALAVTFEQKSKVSLAMSANVLRLVGKDIVHVRDLPAKSGVSKEAIATALSFLTKKRYAIVETESAPRRTKVVFLTPKGRKAATAYTSILADLETAAESRFGGVAIDNLRQSLKNLVGDGSPKSPLFQGIEPHPENWRAKVPRPETLPHFPMVLHRGGYPDGS